jgi:hypothetical protein
MVFRHTCGASELFIRGLGWDPLTVPLMKARKDDAFSSYLDNFLHVTFSDTQARQFGSGSYTLSH